MFGAWCGVRYTYLTAYVISRLDQVTHELLQTLVAAPKVYHQQGETCQGWLFRFRLTSYLAYFLFLSCTRTKSKRQSARLEYGIFNSKDI